MLSSVALSFRSPTPPSPPPPGTHHDPNHPLQTPNPLALSSASSNSTASTSIPGKPKVRASPQLSRWSRARAIRSGRKLDRQGKIFAAVTANPSRPVETTERDQGQSDLSDVSDSSGEDEEAVAVSGKAIYMVSDGTGWTVEHSVNAALGQFEHCLIDRACAINTHLFSGIEEVDRLLEVVKQAAKEGAMLVYTLADPSMTEAARSACKIWDVPSIDMLGPITDAIASHLGVTPSGLPRNAPGRNHLTDEYFRRIEAIEFTIKQDDGALPQNLKKADIVLAGVSRTGKTPLSIYLAQKGYKVANVPIVMGIELPSTLFEVSPRKVFGLTINPLMLQAIRRARAKTLGFGDEVRCNYSEMDYVREELEHARKIFARNPTWPVVEVTGKAIEETAAVVLRLYHDRKQKCSMPRISKRY